MVQEKSILAANDNVRAGVLRFFDNQPDFNIRRASMVTALQEKTALTGVSEEHTAAVVIELKTLQLTQTLAHDPNVTPALIRKGMTSSLVVSTMPESTFIRRMKDDLDVDAARVIHHHAIMVNMRNNRVLTKAYQTIKGTGIAAVDGQEKRQARIKRLVGAVNPMLPRWTWNSSSVAWITVPAMTVPACSVLVHTMSNYSSFFGTMTWT